MAIADIHARIKAAAVQTIKDLEIEGDETFGGIAERVYSQLMPDDSDLRMPCIILTTEGEIEEDLGGDSGSERWRYPVRIWIVDKESHRRHDKESLYLAWRKAIIRTFHHQPMPAVPEAEGCTIRPGVIFDPRLPQYQNVVMSMVLWVSTTEPREAE